MVVFICQSAVVEMGGTFRRTPIELIVNVDVRPIYSFEGNSR